MRIIALRAQKKAPAFTPGHFVLPSIDLILQAALESDALFQKSTLG
jgi:hypothetical protein